MVVTEVSVEYEVFFVVVVGHHALTLFKFL